MGLTPKAVYETSEYPDVLEHPLYRLEATCLKHWGNVVVGESFRWDDENIRLTPTQETSFNEWDRKRSANRLAQGFPYTWMLPCEVCGKRTRHTPEGKTHA